LSRKPNPYSLNQILEGELSPAKSPLFEIDVENTSKSINGVIDTGAYDNHITHWALAQLDIKPIADKKASYPGTGISEQPVYRIQFEIQGINHVFIEEFVLLPYGYNYGFIFGSHFLGDCEELHIYSRESRFQLKI